MDAATVTDGATFQISAKWITLLWHAPFVSEERADSDARAAAALLRGDVLPFKQMEQLQRAYLNAVTAAAGCSILTTDYDDGLDALLKHRSTLHSRSVDQFLQVQLKCTQQVGPDPSSGQVSAPLSNERFKLWAEANPTVKKIVVIMIAPTDPMDWISCSHDHLLLRHCAYWVNIAGRNPTGESKTMVAAPTSQVFDDQALCQMMSRIGQEGAP